MLTRERETKNIPSEVELQHHSSWDTRSLHHNQRSHNQPFWTINDDDDIHQFAAQQILYTEKFCVSAASFYTFLKGRVCMRKQLNLHICCYHKQQHLNYSKQKHLYNEIMQISHFTNKIIDSKSYQLQHGVIELGGRVSSSSSRQLFQNTVLGKFFVVASMFMDSGLIIILPKPWFLASVCFFSVSVFC